MRLRRPTILVSVAAVVAASLLAAGCGGGSASPGVASVATSTTTGTTTTTQSGSGSGDKASGPPAAARARSSGPSWTRGTRRRVRSSRPACASMGAHELPRPNAQGVITFGSDMGIDPNSPGFESARSTCEKLLPNGGQPTPQEQAQRQQELLAFSKCMRAHGLNDFPDPTSQGFRSTSRPAATWTRSNAQFQAAQKACQGHLPFKSPGGAPPATGKSGGG